MDLYDSLGMLNQSIQFAGATMGAVKDKKFIREENEKSRQFQLDMWNKMNEYNMPSAVLQRYSDAGIQVNPNYLVTGKYDGGLASLASSPGHSAPNMNTKDIAKSLDMLAPALQIQNMKNQSAIARSQVELNKSAAAKNYADINEVNSRIPTYEANVNYTNEMIENMKRQNKWYDLTEDVKYSLLEIDKLEKEGRIDLMATQVLRLNAQTANDNKLTDMRLQLTANQISLMWKNYDNSVRELEGRLALWSKQGDAAKIQAVASLLNAATNSKQFDLNKQQFEKFSDAQLKLLQQNSVRLQSENAWIDILNEAKFANIESVTNLNNQRAGYQQNVNQNYDLDHAISIGSILINGLMPMLP